MAARRRAHHTNSLRINFPIFRAIAYSTNGARNILQHHRMSIARRAEAVFQNKTMDAFRRQPIRVAFAFVRSQSAIAATGANYNRRARGFSCPERRERGNVSRCVALLSGSFAGPQWEFLLWKICREHIHGQKNGEQTNQLHARKLPRLAQEA